MQNKSVFLTIMAIFTFFAYRMWQGLLSEGYSLLRAVSLLLIVIGMALMLISRMKAFMREVLKSKK